MSDKPRVYQGVRVKTTVKELLQRHRAREANSKKVKTISQACLELQELCASTFTGRYLDLDPPPAAPPAAPNAAPPAVDARALQLRAAPLPYADSWCGIQMQDGVFADLPQSGNRVLPAGDHCGGGGLEGGGGGYGGSASPWCHGLSSDADYYGPAMAACSSPESLKFCNPADPNCYSPQDSFSSSSSSSCYDSPTRMESGYGGFASEHFHHPHCNLQDCCCLSPRWPAQQEAFSIPDHTPYYTPTEYPYACPVEENYFRRDLSMGSEMCYNLL